MLLIALCMLLLIAVVGLAIDGGSMFGQRREAQNGVDGAALAGTRVMLPYYRDMILANPSTDVDGSYSAELEIRSAIENYAAANGVYTPTMKAYFVTDDRQIVTVNKGVEKSNGYCGVNQNRGPCEVGDNGEVPWVEGAKGIDVRGTARTDSFFMNLFGWKQVGATASATAFMGVGAMADNISLVPVGLYTTTFNIGNIQEGTHYVLIDATLDNGSGNWGWVDFNGQGIPATVVRAWLVCGFNPSATQAQWQNTWCPQYSNASGWGPTQHYIPISQENWLPSPDPTYIYSIVYGEEWHGWWVRGSSGSVNANCQDFKGRIDASGTTGVVVLFPIFDRVVPGGGTFSMYHVRIIVAFRIRQGDVSCRPQQLPTPTPCVGMTCPPTPTPGGGGGGGGGGGPTKWHIEGDAVKIYSTSSSGRHGDLRHTSVPVVFLDR